MKLCKDCQYFKESNYCFSPSNGVSPIDGLPKIKFATANRASTSITIYSSNTDFRCGPDATFFKEKPAACQSWWRIFK